MLAGGIHPSSLWWSARSASTLATASPVSCDKNVVSPETARSPTYGSRSLLGASCSTSFPSSPSATASLGSVSFARNTSVHRSFVYTPSNHHCVSSSSEHSKWPVKVSGVPRKAESRRESDEMETRPWGVV